MVHEKCVALVVFEGEDCADEVGGFFDVHGRVEVVEFADFGDGGVVSWGKGRRVCGDGAGVGVGMLMGMGMGVVMRVGAGGGKEEGIVVGVVVWVWK
jgi:hypothetical protein